ncbi:Quinate permease [Cyphellophora attinorum]|uniref:Quinate permease n=1 Tax=Cyphellophora attinorum TaxID=1664694 RepID=A0A0N0NMI4_9EURO|nr:Quinate permease [Phialophora attinorum]KPI40239.1 Quinate permease [Phialophora attinorum]
MKDQSKRAKYVIPRPRNKYNFFVALFVAVGSLCYGYASSISAALIGQPSWYDYMGLEAGSSYSQAILGLINGIYAAGGAVGCVFNMWACEALGRKKSIQLGCVISIVGAAIMTGSIDIPMFVVSRFIMGFGIGILVTLVPLYQSEVSPAESRGLMVGLHGVLIGFSYSMTGFVTYGCYFAAYGQFQACWRFPLSVQLIPCIVLFIGSFFLPESPRWLIGKDRTDEAWKVTCRLHRSKHDPEDTYAHAEYAQMMAQITFERQHNAVGTLAQARLAFSQKSFLRRLGLGFLVQFGNQCTGALVINNYNAQLFAGLGIKGGTPLLLLGFFNLLTVPGNLFNGLFIDRIGRRRFVITGCIGILVCLSGEAAMTAQFVETGSNNQIGLGFGVFFIFAYVVFYSSCLDATMYLIPSEIFPMVIRSFGMSWSIMGQFIATTILLEAAPTAFKNIGYKFWIILIILTVIYGILVYLYLPETKGMTLEDISVVFGDPVELSFEQALHKESSAAGVLDTEGTADEKTNSAHLEALQPGHERDEVSST